MGANIWIGGGKERRVENLSEINTGHATGGQNVLTS